MTYQIRYCAFVDILGFSGMIKELEGGQLTHDQIADMLYSVHRPPDWDFSIFRGSDLKAQSISDAVCRSATVSAVGLSHLFDSLEHLAVHLLNRGRFLRGAIVKGHLYHDDKMVFGDALVRAHQLESEVAVYPRIMLSKDVVADVAHYRANNPGVSDWKHNIRQSDDGPYYLNILALIERVFSVADRATLAQHAVRYNEIAQQIQMRFDESVDNPRHFQKVQWFARYWNDVVRHHSKRLQKIIGPGVDPPSMVWGD